MDVWNTVKDLVDTIEPKEDWSMLDLSSKVTTVLKGKGESELKAEKKRDLTTMFQDSENCIQEPQPKKKKRDSFDCDLYVGEELSEEDNGNPEPQPKKKTRRDFSYRDRYVEEEEKEMPEKKKTKKKKSEKKKVRSRNTTRNCNPMETPPAPMTEALKNKITEHFGNISEDSIKLAIQKTLSASDLADHQNRFSIPTKKIICGEFLTEEEKDFLKTRNEDGETSYKVVKTIPPLEEKTGELRFRRWVMKKGSDKRPSISYVLNGEWSHFAKRNRLREKMEVQLWTFRNNEGDLCFALANLSQSKSTLKLRNY